MNRLASRLPPSSSPPSSLIDTILFDLDGTLIDTEPAAARAINECFSRWGIQISPDDAQFITGRTWASAFQFLFNKYRIPVAAEEASGLMMKTYREALEEKLHQVPGSADAVRALAGRYRLALVSGSGRKEILWALDRLSVREHFEVILGAEDYPRSKPEPDGYSKALKLLGAEASRGLVFEDSQAGIASARAAGLWVVAITTTNHFGQDTSAAHHHIPDLRSVDASWVADLSQRLLKE